MDDVDVTERNDAQKKQKALDNINYRMRGENTLAMIEVLTPMVEKVRKAYVLLGLSFHW